MIMSLKNIEESISNSYAIYNKLKILKEKNYRTVTVLIHRDNYPSIISHEKFSFEKYVICYCFSIWKMDDIQNKL